MNPLENIRVVLVGTLYAGNVGSSCRAMANMGIRHLRLAAPNLHSPWDEGERMAVHATDILNAREEFATFEEAVADIVLDGKLLREVRDMRPLIANERLDIYRKYI